MLDKVLNINANKPYADKKTAVRTYEKFVRDPHTREFFPKDSIVFSPAAVYLSKLNWFVKEVKFTTDNKVHLVFYISEFEFQTNIDFLNFYSNIRQEFKINKKNIGDYKDSLLSVNLSIKKQEVVINDSIENYRLTGVKNLFSRINNMNLGTKLKRTDSYALNGLIDGIKEELTYEIEQIQSAVYTFIQKFDKFKFNENYIFEDDGSDILIIERISKEYV
ncbi:MAG: hypothetical protein V1773_07745 [bacterium]